jgi:hypothetical protein
MLERAGHNLGLLAGHELFATAPAGRLLHEQLEPPVRCFRSGPCGSDQQIRRPGSPGARSTFSSSSETRRNRALPASNNPDLTAAAHLKRAHGRRLYAALSVPSSGCADRRWCVLPSPVSARTGPGQGRSIHPRGQANQIREQHGHNLAFLIRRRLSLHQDDAALGAELRVRRVCVTARAANTHPQSLRRLPGPRARDHRRFRHSPGSPASPASPSS